MSALQEKLKSMMDGYTKAMQKVKDDSFANRYVYTPEKSLELANAEKEKIKTSALQQATALGKDFETSLFNMRANLRAKKYPNLSSSDPNSRLIAESQFAEGRALLESQNSEKILNGLRSALSLDRMDLVSFVLDNLDINAVKNSSLEIYNKFDEIRKKVDAKINAADLIKEILAEDEDSQINSIFIQRATKGREFIPYPFSMGAIKQMPKNVVSVNMDAVDSAMEIRNEVSPSLT